MILTHFILFEFLPGASGVAAGDVPVVRERGIFRFVFSRVFGRVN